VTTRMRVFGCAIIACADSIVGSATVVITLSGRRPRPSPR
jgi:hypothetical protein